MLIWGLNVAFVVMVSIAPTKAVRVEPGDGVAGGPIGPVACCLPDGSCQPLGVRLCLRNGGIPHSNSTCEGTICPAMDTGACCSSQMGGVRNCMDLTGIVCESLGGNFQGNGTTCEGNPGAPPICGAPTFACCRDDGSCSDVEVQACLAEGGVPHFGQSCNQVECGDAGVGACCVGNGGFISCLIVPRMICSALQGDFHGIGTDCQSDNPGGPAPCQSSVVACCLPQLGVCVEAPENICIAQGGNPQNASSCMGITCEGGEPQGACCTFLPGAPPCIEASPAGCAHLNGIYQGNGTHCPNNPMEPNPCSSNVVPCCILTDVPEGHCEELSIVQCLSQGGQPHPNAESCASVQCFGDPETGACCVAVPGAFTCLDLTQEQCAQFAGEFHAGLSCDVFPTHPPCEQGGNDVACCLPNGECEVLPVFICQISMGIPQNSISCTGVDCGDGPNEGACCLHIPGLPRCVVISEQQCTNNGGTYHGDGSDCPNNPFGPSLCNNGGDTVPCCILSAIPEGLCLELTIQECLVQNGEPHPDADSCSFALCFGEPDVGGCCLGENGAISCMILSEQQCDCMNGNYLGDGSNCQGNSQDPTPCGNPTFACCLPNGNCLSLPLNVCVNEGGMPQNTPSCMGVVCNGGDDDGACCISGNVIFGCTEVTARECAKIGGEFQGRGTHCGNSPADPGACGPLTVPCCVPSPLPEGSCINVHPNVCMVLGGEQVPGNQCTPNSCNGQPPVGGCCLDLLANPLGCAVVSEQQCVQSGGEYLGDGTDCIGNPNEPLPCNHAASACCLPNGNCLVLPAQICLNEGGTPQNSLHCQGIMCGGGGGTGACCRNTPGFSECVVVTEQQCNQIGGEYHGNNTDCQGDPGQPPICSGSNVACCLPQTGTCVEVTPQHCLNEGGQPHNTPNCEEVNCTGGPIIGACCLGGGGFLTCLNLNEGSCNAIGGEFQGANTHCPNSPLEPNPCQP